jgi:acetate kinase
MLNKKSGLLGLSGGLSSDMKTLLDKYDSETRAALAVDVFVYTVQKFIGQLLASLEYNVDAIVFTGGIGENSAEIRRRVTSGMNHLGINLDHALNIKPTGNGVISMKDSKVKVFAIKTNEELQIARDSIIAANAI